MIEIRKEVPVICAECQNASIHCHNLFCEKKQKTVYNAKPKWCPLPNLFVIDDEPKQQETIVTY